MRATVTGTLSRFGRRPTAGRILLYHEVRDDVGWTMGVPQALWTRQLAWIAEWGLSCADVAACLDAHWPARVVGLSFDDGYVSAGRACAGLVARGWSATLFVVPSWIDKRRAGALTWGDVSELAGAGIEIGAHGLDHERLCERDAEPMARSLREARARIQERVGAAVRGLAYPEGLAPASARRAAHLAGFEYACTTLPGSNASGTDAFALRRNEIFGRDGRALLLGKLAGADDWMAPVRRVEHSYASRSTARRRPEAGPPDASP